MFADYPRAHLPRSSLLPVDWPVSAQSEARTMYDLLGDREHGRDFDLHTEKVLMKGGAILSVELFHGLKPYIVIWSKHSSQNRIVIEVKQAPEFSPSH